MLNIRMDDHDTYTLLYGISQKPPNDCRDKAEPHLIIRDFVEYYGEGGGDSIVTDG